MATAAAAAKGPKELTFSWEGKDKAGKVIRGELRAVSEAAVNATLRRLTEMRIPSTRIKYDAFTDA